ncbi:hypothetical protein TNCV_4264421 [Trichonephila clavipes]|nr:hypothetical protein TNCV_4264421 [Trichonephila clavipes]
MLAKQLGVILELNSKSVRNEISFRNVRDRIGIADGNDSSSGCGSRVVKVSDRGFPRHVFEPGTTKDPPCRAAMHVKSVES